MRRLLTSLHSALMLLILSLDLLQGALQGPGVRWRLSEVSLAS